MLNDGYLYTGMTSASYNRTSVREAVKQAKKEAQTQLEPAAEIIFSRIELEKARMGETLAGLVDSSQTPAEVQAHVEAVKLHRQWLQSFEAQFKADLRNGRVKAESDDE